MRVQLAQQAQEILGQSDLVIITERVDDVALLIGQMVKMGLVEVLDRHLPRHWKQRRVSWGWTAVIWLAYILTEGAAILILTSVGVQGCQSTPTSLRWRSPKPQGGSDDDPLTLR
jgi:transposase